uniref:Serpin peptidase inhibitor, clade I (neuroserpin), member 1 n=1 Tax=Eptatretus burgeri TaxID=7764 RepID=A0A8C4N150_EPTBU
VCLVLVQHVRPMAIPASQPPSPASVTAPLAVATYGALRVVADTVDSNLLFSPLAVASSLGLVGLGARGRSKEQLQAALQMRSLNTGGFLKSGAGELRFATGLFVAAGLRPDEAFLRAAVALGNASVQSTDFAQPSKAARHVDQWLHARDSQLQSLDVSPTGQLVVVSALEFRGKWERAFLPELTHRFPFSCDDGTQIMVAMMFKQAEMLYGEVPEGQVLELEYAGSHLGLVLGLPRQDIPLVALEKQLHPRLLSDWPRRLKKQMVELYLPRYDLVSQCKPHFTSVQLLGLVSIQETSDLFVSRVMHRAFIEVNEEGNEAISRSSTMSRMAGYLYPQFIADHPFLFALRNRQTDAILLMGRLSRPQSMVHSEF